MSEKATIEPQYIEGFIEHLGVGLCLEICKLAGKGCQKIGRKEKLYSELKPKEMAEVNKLTKEVMVIVSMGMLLATRQPQLTDAHIQYLNSMHAGYADELLNAILDSYKEFLYFKHFVDK